MKYSATPTEELRDLLIDKLFENPNDLVVEDTIDYITNTQKEITKLQQENKQLKEEIEEYKRIEQADLKAFNNYDSILTELEEWLKEEWNITSKSPKGSFYEGYDTCMLEMKEDIQNKIQELKEKYKC